MLKALIDGGAGIETLAIERPGLHDAFVAIADPNDARLRMFGNENHGKGLVFRRRVSGGKHLNRRSLRVRLEPVNFVLHGESRGHAAHYRTLVLWTPRGDERTLVSFFQKFVP